MLCNKTVELHNHALMYAHVNTQLVETKKTCLYSFFFHSIKIYWATLCPNLEYSSEHGGAYNPAASQPITSVILTLLL